MTTVYNRRNIAISEIAFYRGSGDRLDYEILHRYAKWHAMRPQGGTSATFDTFSGVRYYAGLFTQSADDSIQASHTYIDTIYVHKGQSISLAIPDKMDATVSASAYQRWYNFRTDGLFRTNEEADGVYDLLTPSSGQSGSRMANGYVGSPLHNSLYSVNFYYPTDDEFDDWKNALGQDNNNYYLVAADVSPYRDFYNPDNYQAGSANNGQFIRNGSTNCYEPTLSHRVLFYVIGVDDRTGSAATETWNKGHGRLTNSDYQGGGNTEGKKYLEEYEISLPFTRTSNYTDELVSLSKDARAYAIPGESASDETETLNITIAGNDAGIHLVTNDNGVTTNRGGQRAQDNATINGENRRIFFAYPNQDRTYGTYTVADPNSDGVSTATILVTKRVGSTIYNIARYRLTFRAEASLLTYSQLDQIRRGQAAGTPWAGYDFRVPEYLDNEEESGLKLLTKLDFDYDEQVAQDIAEDGNYQAGYYPFPLEWGSSSYSFYDGATTANGEFNNTNQFAEWGFYALMSGYKEYNDLQVLPTQLYEGDTYHMYIDASDRPGIIAQLPFTEPLCPGSELFVTAWVKSANEGSDDGAMLFTIMGVGADGSMTPLYRHYTGQIRRTDELNTNIPGCATDHQEWWQLYFSFINEGHPGSSDDAQEDYVSYVLQIENYCASTSGGDFCLDNIRIYIAQPSAEVTQLEATCVGEATKMSIGMDWNRLASRLGIDNETADRNTTRYLDVAFLDLTKFNQDMEEVGNDITKLDDFGQYLMPIYRGVNDKGEGIDAGATIASIAFREVFGENAVYNTDADNFAFQGSDYTAGTFYRQGRLGVEDGANAPKLLADFYSQMTPNYPYVLLIRTRNAGEELSTAQDFVYDYDNPCAINTDFRVTSQAILKVNGDIVEPDVTYCAGNIFNFSTQVQIPYVVEGDPNEHYLTVDHGVYFDWFFGTKDEYLAVDEKTYGVSLRDALLAFREVYPDAETFGEAVTPAADGFTEKMYGLIHYYMEDAPTPEGGHNRPLVLHQENINITFLETGLYLIVQPIKTVTPPGGLTLPDGTAVDEDHWNAVCWEYIPLMLEADDNAPELHAGFGTVNYPAGVEPGLRIGLDQIEAVTTGNQENNTLTVELRDARASSDEVSVSYLGMVRCNVEDYTRIFLVGTNDPAYDNEDFLGAASYDPYSLPIGTIHSLRANVEAASNNVGTMQITFDQNSQTVYAGTNDEKDFAFAPKEGYYYTFLSRFEEYTGSGSTAAVTNSCIGSFTITMYVVPEYLVWQGEATGNWNNDRNWHRADMSELNYSGTEYATNDVNYAGAAEDTKASAYVPMLFSKVIIPTEHPVVELYPAGFVSGVGNDGWESEKPDHIGPATADIQYDLMVYEKNAADPGTENLPRFSTQKYRVALCDQIHFEPGTQMLHSQYLLYNKAWVDVEVPAKKWTNVGVPLRDVVAGDWYTQATGSDAALPYFTDMTKAVQGAGSPYVYQRRWGSNVSIVGGGVPNASLGVSEWSVAYNDAAVPYTAGAGFSLKAAEGTGSNGKLLFRLPKSDASYSVTSGAAISRTNAGQLAALQLFKRNKDSYSGETTATENQSFSVDLQPSEDGQYFIVGNPFVSHLDVQKFLETNVDVLAQEYWLTVEKGDPMTVNGVLDVNNGEWVSTSTGSAFIAPHGAFYVKRASTGTGNVPVKFTADMQSLNLPADEEGTTTQGLSIEALGDGGRSTALVSFSGRADDGYAEGEDVQLVDFGSGATVPMVYSVAGQKAAAINRLSAAQQIPLGVYAPGEDEAVTLTFRGVGNLAEASLYDAETRTETPLTEGYELTVTGSSHGRYFLRAAGDFTSLDELPQDAATGVSVYSVLPGELIVAAAGQRLEHVAVYDASGAQVFSSGALAQDVCKAGGLQAGTYVVVVQAGGRTESHKIALQ